MSIHTRTLTINERDVEYRIRKRRGQKTISLSVRANGCVTVTIPRWVPLAHAERFVRAKTDWLMRVLANRPVHTDLTRAKEHAQYLAHREAARAMLTEHLARLNKHYGFSYGRISVRNNTSRWGSCSTRGNLNFDYRILFLPSELQDYLVVHELCHLKEHNHGPLFWSLVAKTIPRYAFCRKQLGAVRRDTLLP